MRKTIIAAAGALLLAGCAFPLMPGEPAASPGLAGAPADPAALAAAGRYGEAVALLEQEAQRRPDAALFGNLGYAYFLEGRFEEAQAALERACLLEPSSAVAWERLAALLEAAGETGRALEAMRQARMLRETPGRHSPAGSGAAAGGEAAAGAGPDAAGGAGRDAGTHGAADLWPAGMARVEVRQVNAGLVEVARREPREPREARNAAREQARPPAAARLEVSNGNGVRGMAAAVAQRLRAEGMQVVRLTNTIPFNVEETRVEVRGSGEPGLRIVLGRDLAPEIKKPPGFTRRQAP
jgi:tetratricopeptide (TPR) repeat protein